MISALLQSGQVGGKGKPLGLVTVDGCNVAWYVRGKIVKRATISAEEAPPVERLAEAFGALAG